MVRLGGLSPSCSSRNRARLLAFRSQQESAGKEEGRSEGEAVKQHWATLTTDEKLNILRLQDQALAQEMYEIQQSLYAADYECYILGFHGQDKVRRKAGIQFFDVEGILDKRGCLSPKAFIFHRAFVEMDNIFGFIEERLGRPFLQGVNHLERQQWLSLLKPWPESWLDFARVALRLVELALWESHAAAMANTPCDQDFSSSVMTQSAKRKARKKRTMTSLAASNDESAALLGSVSALEANETQHDLSSLVDGGLDNGDGALDGSTNLTGEDILTTSGSNDVDSGLVVSQSPTRSASEAHAVVAEATSFDPPQSRSILDEDILLPCEKTAFEAHVVAPPIEFTTCLTPGHSSVTENAGSVLSTRADDNHISTPVVLDYDRVPFVSQSRAQSSREARIASPKRSAMSEFFDSEPVLSASQSLRQSARAARVDAVVMPALIASQASRASAAESWVRAEIRMREDRGRSRPPWLLADGTSGEDWATGFKAVIKNTFIDLEEVDTESSAARAYSLPMSWRIRGA